MFSMILEDQFEELEELSLLSLNGGACTGSSGGNKGSVSGSGSTGGYTSGGCTGSSSGSSSGSGSTGGYTSGGCTSGGCTSSNSGGYIAGGCTSGGCTSSGGSSTIIYTQQRDFSGKYGKEFGDHACAATSLLNEISEQYTKETGKTLTQSQIDSAMAAAVNSGNVDKTDAFVNDWAGAANAMAQTVGLKGSYTYTTDSSKADATIYASDTNGSGYVNHFVNDIGNGQYYDPWTGQTGNVSDLTLATQGLGNTRQLDYSGN